jgi:hypothetical protein
MAALVKFYRGTSAKYDSTTHANGIYFAYDTRVIKMNGVDYTGVSMDDFDGFVKDLSVSGTTLSYKKYNKTSQEWVDGSVELLAIEPADNSVVITPSNGGAITIGVNVMSLTDVDGLKLDADNGLYVDFTKHNASIKANTDAIAILNGEETVDGSVKKTVKDAVEALDATDSIESGKFVASVSETDGVISVTKGKITSTDKTVTVTPDNGGNIDLAVNVDGESIVVDENTGALSVANSALIPYVGADAIKVSDVVDSKKTISLGINSEDKVLSQSENGLLATLSMSYDSTEKTIKLLGKDSAEISTIDASDFVKDGMLAGTSVFMATAATQSVTIAGQTKEFEDLTEGHHYMVFLFKIDGKTVTYEWSILDATDIIDTYNAGDGLALSVDRHTFSVVKDTNSEAFLTVSDKGVKVSGVQDAIDTAAKKATTAVAIGADEKHISISSAPDATDSHTVYTITSTDVASAADLTNEIAARKVVDGQSGDTYAANTDATYIKDATSLNEADVKLDAAVAVLEAALSWVDLDATE